MEEAIAALDRAIRARPIHERDESEYAAKYGDASPEVLAEAYRLVKARVDELQKDIVDQRLASGDYEMAIVQPGEAPPLPSTPRSSGTLLTVGFNEPAGDGALVAKTIQIAPQNYPELQESIFEMMWLQRQLGGVPPPGGGH